jgi:hypothetical protein
MATRHSTYQRDAHDWYLEPDWAVDLLLDALPGITELHDPCCGIGTIVKRALHRGINATGADLVDRTEYGFFPRRDFLKDTSRYANIVSNPPYRQAEAIIKHALRQVAPGGTVAIFVPIGFLASQKRAALHQTYCREVLIHANRPSVPNGQLIAEKGEAARHSGSVDYAWLVYRPEPRVPGTRASLDWLRRERSCAADRKS